MKKLILLFSSIFFLSTAQAQNSFPLPSDNPFWIESHSAMWACSYPGTHFLCDDYHCKCDKPVYYKSDTTINDTIYNRLYTRGVCRGVSISGPPAPGCPHSFNYYKSESLLAIVRQDSASNILFLREHNKEIVLYDFDNIIVGQYYPKTYNNVSQDTLVVVSEDSIFIGNSYSKKWNLGIRQSGLISDSAFVSIIEGIGSTFGIIAPLVRPFEDNNNLLCYSENDDVLYPDTNYSCDKTLEISEIENQDLDFTLFPNPSSEFLNIIINSKNPNKGLIRIFNVNGKEVYSCFIQERETQIDISFFNTGLYLVLFNNQDKSLSRMFIKN